MEEHPQSILVQLQQRWPVGGRIAGIVMLILLIGVPVGGIGLALFHRDIYIFLGVLTTALGGTGLLFIFDPDWLARESGGDQPPPGLQAHFQGFFGGLSWRLQTWLLETSPRSVRRGVGGVLLLLGIVGTLNLWADIDVIRVVQGWAR